jgi:hypothetical protein
MQAMTERVLWVIPWWMPQRTEGGMASGRALSRYDLTIFTWPTFKNGPRFAPTWQASVEALREAIGDGCHVIDTGPTASLSLLAVSGDTHARSLIMGGIIVPPATLEALGMATQAEGSSVFFRMERTYQIVRLNMQGADEETLRRVADGFDAGLDWPRMMAFQQSLETLNLVEEDPHVTIPTLYLDPPLTAAGYTDMAEVVLRFAPGARVEKLELYPVSMHEARTGLEFASKAIPFIDEIAARNET